MKSIIDYTNKLKSFFAEKQALANEVSARATLGAHNLIPRAYVDEVVGGELSVHVEDDGSLTVSTIGTTTAARQYIINWHYYFPQGTYILSGAPDEGQGQNYCLYFSHNLNYYDTGKGATAYVNTSGYSSIVLSVAAGQNFSNKKFYPMLRLATDTDTTYQPYAMTNQQLTDELSVEDASANVTSVDAAFSDIDILKTGKVVQITATIAAGTTAGVKQFKVSKYAPKMISTCNGVALSDAADAGKVISAQVLDSGWAYISLSSTLTAAVKVGFVYITA